MDLRIICVIAVAVVAIESVVLWRAVRGRRRLLRLLASMAHELKTPLNSIIGFSDLMDHETFGPIGTARYKEYAGLIHSSGQYMLSLVLTALQWAELQSGITKPTPTTFPVDKLLSDVMDVVKGIPAAQNKDFTVRVDDGLTVRSDRRCLQQMLLNLASNAAKFTDDGGKIEISAVQKGEFVELSVADDGIGMDSRQLRVITKPFTRLVVARNSEGSGLGLNIVKTLARRLNGRLKISSEPGKGTTATVRLKQREPRR